MNIKDLKASLPYLFKANVTAFLWAHCGVGKSTVIKQYAEEKGFKFFPFYLGAMSDVGDVLGLASFVKDKDGKEVATQFAPPIWIKEMIDYCEKNPESGAVILLDEFNRARRDILNGMFSLALDKTFHTIKLPANCHIIAAGNPPTDEYFTTDINETALMARFVHIKLEPSVNEWVDYAKAGEFEPTLISFIQEQPELLEEVKSAFTLPVKVDRRSYERANRLFKLTPPQNILDQLLIGIIGAERLVAYKAHLGSAEKPLTGKEVLSGKHLDKVTKWSSPVDIKASLVGSTCDNLMATMEELDKKSKTFTDVQGAALVDFFETIPKDMAYSFFLKLVQKNLSNFLALQTSKYESRLLKIVTLARASIPKKAA